MKEAQLLDVSRSVVQESAKKIMDILCPSC